MLPPEYLELAEQCKTDFQLPESGAKQADVAGGGLSLGEIQIKLDIPDAVQQELTKGGFGTYCISDIKAQNLCLVYGCRPSFGIKIKSKMTMDISDVCQK